MIYMITRSIVTALINNDFTGLSESEIILANRWDEHQGDKAIEILDYNTSFERCDLSGLMSDCLEIEIHNY